MMVFDWKTTHTIDSTTVLHLIDFKDKWGLKLGLLFAVWQLQLKEEAKEKSILVLKDIFVPHE